ncbi:MAG: hypothetical protein ACKO96_44500, partial [Flammeovirgaceae bacterium]
KRISEYDYQEFVNPSSERKPLRVPLDQENNINWEKYNELAKNVDFTQNNILVDVRPEEQFNIASLKDFNIINKFPYALALVFSDPATSENTAANTAK